MIKHSDQRVGVFVDVQNMYYSAKNIYNSKVNFGEILKTAVAGRKLIRAIAYVIKADSPEEQSFFDALSNQGFEIKMKDLQIFFGGAKKGDWDVGVAVDAIRLADKFDVIVIVSGDGDFVPLVEYLKFIGQQVEVVAFGKSAASKLIEASEDFTDLCLDEGRYLLRGRSLGGLKRLVHPIQRVTRPSRGGKRPPMNGNSHRGPVSSTPNGPPRPENTHS